MVRNDTRLIEAAKRLKEYSRIAQDCPLNHALILKASVEAYTKVYEGTPHRLVGDQELIADYILEQGNSDA